MRPRIVVVDDNPADVFVLLHALREMGVDPEVTVLQDGEHAVQWFETAEPEQVAGAVVIDLNLPCRDGLEVLGRLRLVPQWVKVPAFIFSSSEDPEVRLRAAALGAVYLPKPASLDGFLATASVITAVCTGASRKAAGSASGISSSAASGSAA